MREVKKDRVRREAGKKVEKRVRRVAGEEETRRGLHKVIWELTIGKSVDRAIAAF